MVGFEGVAQACLSWTIRRSGRWSPLSPLFGRSLTPLSQYRRPPNPQKRALEHPKIEILWNSVVEEAYGNAKGQLGGVKLKNVKTGGLLLRRRRLPAAGVGAA